MFEDLDDPAAVVPEPVDTIRRRGRKLRARRRVVGAAGAVALVAATALAIPAATGARGSQRHVNVSAAPTTTTNNDSRALPPPNTVPPENAFKRDVKAYEYTNVRTVPDRSSVQLASGAYTDVVATVTNDGPWTVRIQRGPTCSFPVDGITGLWIDNPQDRPWPIPGRLFGGATSCTGANYTGIGGQPLAPGASMQVKTRIAAGVMDGNGHILPSTPGTRNVSVGPNGGVRVTVTPGPNPVTVTGVPSVLHLAPGEHRNLDFQVRNELGFAMEFAWGGPCQYETGTDQICRGFDYAVPLDRSYRRSFVVGGNQTLNITADINARKGLAKDGAPLAPGSYKLRVGGTPMTLVVDG